MTKSDQSWTGKCDRKKVLLKLLLTRAKNGLTYKEPDAKTSQSDELEDSCTNVGPGTLSQVEPVCSQPPNKEAKKEGSEFTLQFIRAWLSIMVNPSLIALADVNRCCFVELQSKLTNAFAALALGFARVAYGEITILISWNM